MLSTLVGVAVAVSAILIASATPARTSGLWRTVTARVAHLTSLHAADLVGAARVVSMLIFKLLGALVVTVGGVDPNSKGMIVMIANTTEFIVAPALQTSKWWPEGVDGSIVRRGVASLPSFEALRFTLLTYCELCIVSLLTETVMSVPAVRNFERRTDRIAPLIVTDVMALALFYAFTYSARKHFVFREDVPTSDAEADDAAPTYDFVFLSLFLVVAFMYSITTIRGGRGMHHPTVKGVNVSVAMAIAFYLTASGNTTNTGSLITDSLSETTKVAIGFAAYTLLSCAQMAVMFSLTQDRGPSRETAWNRRYSIAGTLLIIFVPMFLLAFNPFGLDGAWQTGSALLTFLCLSLATARAYRHDAKQAA